ncbi:hypothetical protein BS47DRAFT_1338723 [Hydnum rufescens UP504]|uniref:Macrofage activating glycoprotein n=1 Tax=Hydnum rufescens UP504 TaxID=1448309 RepID=A0A9P6B666_9AGAM|nr:hypothetical protein BS47DRAFT_1338723 [Hydnum rufescens UP504]
MSPHAHFVVTFLTTASLAAAQVIPLTQRIYPYSQIPYKVDTDTTGRGPQSGYNLCNSTTEGPTSLCQTALVNSIDDFCVWGPPIPNSTIGDTEAESVAWCSKPGHGSRIMPAGTLTAVQFLKAPAYIQVTGLLNQVNIDLTADDGGGEMDPHGADERGNPLGALVYTNAFPSNNGNNGSYQQVIQWHNFMGSGQFCFKACDPAVGGSAQYCNNLFDRIGCNYVAPASYAPNEYTVCDSENQDPPGIYTDSAGAVHTYTQPPESLGPITSIPYTPKVPQTSNCVTFTSSLLYAAEGTASGSSSSPTATGTGIHGTSTGTGKPTTRPTASGSSSVSTSAPSNAAGSLRGSLSPFYAAGTGVFVTLAMSLMAGLGAAIIAL